MACSAPSAVYARYTFVRLLSSVSWLQHTKQTFFAAKVNLQKAKSCQLTNAITRNSVKVKKISKNVPVTMAIYGTFYGPDALPVNRSVKAQKNWQAVNNKTRRSVVIRTTIFLFIVSNWSLLLMTVSLLNVTMLHVMTIIVSQMMKSQCVGHGTNERRVRKWEKKVRRDVI